MTYIEKLIDTRFRAEFVDAVDRALPPSKEPVATLLWLERVPNEHRASICAKRRGIKVCLNLSVDLMDRVKYEDIAPRLVPLLNKLLDELLRRTFTEMRSN